MTRVQGTTTGGTTAPGRSRRPRRPRRRGLELAGLAIGIAAGVSIALGWLVPALNHPSRLAAPSVSRPVLIKNSSAGPDPAALDAQWVAYSDDSSCADWAGADGVSAIRLNSSQLAWFFNDTTIGPAGPAIGFTHLSGFVHNSLVIQTTTKRGSTFVTMTGGGACTGPGRPGNAAPVVGPPPAVPGGPSARYWEEDGITVGGTIVKFYNHYLAGIEPYVPVGTVIASFPVSQLSSAGRGSRYGAVARPQLVTLPSYTPGGYTSRGGGTPILWGAALLHTGKFVYVYGTQSPDVSAPYRRLYLARVPISKLAVFSAWRFYAGDGRWAASQSAARPVQPRGSKLSVPSGFSVVKVGQRYWLIQAGTVVGSPDIDAYPAAEPWGPFDFARGRLLYRDPAIGLDEADEYRIMYEARAEPALSTPGTLVISYNVNSEAVTAGCEPMSSFTNTAILPRFISVPLTVFGNGARSGSAPDSAPDSVADSAPDSVKSGPQPYPPIVQKDPSQWFDAWSYPGDCPPVPAVTSVRAAPGAGKVTLNWPDAGLDITYLVYLDGPGEAGDAPVASPSGAGATITGLRPGTYRAKVVPLNFYKHAGPAAAVTFTVP